MPRVRLVAGLRIAHGANNASDQGVLRMQAFDPIFSLNTASPIQYRELRNVFLHNVTFHRE